MLCVLLGHALVVWLLIGITHREAQRRPSGAEPFVTQLIPVFESYDDSMRPLPDPTVSLSPPDLAAADRAAAGDAATTEAAGAPGTNAARPGYTDWPKEGRDAAARVLARQAETERIAKMFAGPQGTWASLTKRQQSELNHFRWKPGVDGLERDEKGNTLYRVSEGCTLVNFSMIACALGKKPPAYGDMFKDMRLYFDEQRRPQSNEGNGREPESLRPPYWSKPLE